MDDCHRWDTTPRHSDAAQSDGPRSNLQRGKVNDGSEGAALESTVEVGWLGDVAADELELLARASGKLAHTNKRVEAA